MNILVIGSGGREHLLAWKIKKSPLLEKLYCAPGNGGMEKIAQCVDIKADDIKGLLEFATENDIDLTVVGPEAPLVAGIVDAFENEGLRIFGPNKQAAQLEGSKIFAKEFMKRCNIPTPAFKVFEDSKDAITFLKGSQFPLVIKADGLAAGKGVYVCNKLGEGLSAIDEIMEKKIFKEAGIRVVIEECLQGEEASIMAICDGEDYVILDSSQDHKRIFDDDLGPNTGGMGAYSPAPIVNEETLKKIEARIVDPAIRGMQREGMPFRGVLYAGLMITAQGPMTLEFNVRFGDPEAQVVIPRMKEDIVEMMMASCDGRLGDFHIEWDPRRCVCVVMSSGGYPSDYEKGFEIKGLESVEEEMDTFVFHAGTKKEGNKIVTSGGRVLGVTALADNIEKTIKFVYKQVEKINFERCFFRRDIGAKALYRAEQLPEAPTHR